MAANKANPQQIANHYSRLLSRWPTDRIRPVERHFQNLLRERIKQTIGSNTSTSTSTSNGGREVNAAYLLLDNTFTKQYPLPEAMMKPASMPDHYTNLARELEEAPDRTWWGNMQKRLKNMIRMR
ncbi:hypothetical protein LTR62_008147 [Meristemomyces frigidus]|uniref:Uncharacterized protein n=1 Tax=Meristemomyces frigidus TaxID=1508187 RepID=A0AAN7TIE1_9PEZI|nr:hypothetical protein LTR62_008147 [Meristemomyces frigidus]